MSASEQIGGYWVGVWVETFLDVHRLSSDGPVRLEWPNGGTYLEQEQIVIIAFRIIEEEFKRYIKEAQKRGKRN